MLNIDDRLIKEIAPVIKSDALSILLSIAVHLNRESGNCFPSHARLMALTGLSRDKVYQALATLRNCGLLLSEQARDHGNFGRRTFRVTTKFIHIFVSADQCEPLVESTEDSPLPEIPETVEPDTVNPETEHINKEKERINNKGTLSAANAAAGEQNGSSPTLPTGDATATPAPRQYPEDFAAFWQAYKFSKGSKAVASQRWGKLTADEKAQAMAALPLHVLKTVTSRRNDKGDKGEFKPLRCYPEVYISQKRWEAYGDELKERLGGDSEPTPHDGDYQKYLNYAKEFWPEVMACVAYLSKKDFLEYKAEDYAPRLSSVGNKMRLDEFMISHNKWEAGDEAARQHETVWAYHKDRLAKLIENLLAI